MIKRTVTYKDYDGNDRKEDLYFNLTQFEATEIAMELPDGTIEELGNSNDGKDEIVVATHLVERLGNKGIIDFIKKVVLKSYGVKSPDGRRFIKSEELSTEFSQTPVFSEFMMELLSDDNAASAFISGVIPPDLAAKIADKSTTN